MVKLRESGKQAVMRQERLLGATMLVSGLLIVGLSVAQMGLQSVVHAQATPPSPSTIQEEKPAESRPTTPAPEPARSQPIPDATPNSTTGSSSTGNPPPAALPPAPAEKIGEPIRK